MPPAAPDPPTSRRRFGRWIGLIGLTSALALTVACDRRGATDATEAWLDLPSPLPTPAAPGSRFPRLSGGPNGELIMSWLEPGAEGVFELRYTAWHGDGWATPATVASAADWFVNWADFPSVVPLGGDRLGAHWLQQTPGNVYAYRVRIAISADGGTTWSVPMSPHEDESPTEHGFVSMWPTATGALQAVWLDGRNTGGEHGHAAPAAGAMTLHTAAVDERGLRAGADIELDARVCDCCQTDAALTSDGPVVVFRDRDANEVRDIAITRLHDSRWSTPALVHADGWTMPACPVNGPAVAARDRTVAVAWFTAAGGPRVRLAWSANAGRSFAAPIDVATGPVAGRVDVALLADGRAVVSWLAGQASRAVLNAQPFDHRGPAGSPVVVSSSSIARASGFPQMATIDGGLVFAWTDVTGSGAVRSAYARLR